MAGSGYLFRALDQYLELAKESSKRWQDALVEIKNKNYGSKELLKDAVEQWESALRLYLPSGSIGEGATLVNATIQHGDADTADKTVLLSSSPANVQATDLREIGGSNTYSGKLNPSFDPTTMTLTIDFESLGNIAIGQYLAAIYEAPKEDPLVLVHLLVV